MERIDINILGRDYSLACLPSERETLLSAIKLVDQRMLSVKNGGKTSGNERIAVMASIQIALELLAMRAPDGPLGSTALGDFKQKLDDMHSMLDQALGPAA